MWTLDHLCALLPLKALDRSKSRLAWPAAERDRLVRGLVVRTLDVLAHAGLRSRFVVSRDPLLDAELLEEDVERLDLDADTDLNGAVHAAAAVLVARGYRAMLMLPADLPCIDVGDVLAMIGPAAPDRAIVARAHDGGTNGLVVPLPLPFGCAFASDGASAARHTALARDAGLTPIIVQRDGLAFDLDTPADLVHFAPQFGAITPGALLHA